MVIGLGEFYSLSCAVVWAAAVVLFRKSGESLGPFALNLFKNGLAAVLLGLTDLTRRHGTSMLIGAGMAPGLSGLIARYLVELGIDSISLTPDRVLRTMQAVQEIEQRQGRPARKTLE